MSNFKNFYREREKNFKQLAPGIRAELPPENPDPMQEGLVITFEQSKRETRNLVFSSANTVWWTGSGKDLRSSSNSIPLDCFGSPLFQNDNVNGWFNKEAIISHPAYGKEERRLRNFMLAHAKNIHFATTRMPDKSFDLVKDFKSFVKFCDDNNI